MSYYTGIKFFADVLDVEYDQILAAFSFYSGNIDNKTVLPENWSGSQSATGILTNISPSPTYFFANNGTGTFSGINSILISGKDFSLNNNTLFLSYGQSINAGNQILLTTATGDSYSGNAGYLLGINSANKLYFKYWNPIEGVYTFTYSKILSDKNLIILNRNNSVITMGRYNNNTYSFDTEEFSIYQNALKNNSNTQLFIGGCGSDSSTNSSTLWALNYFDTSHIGTWNGINPSTWKFYDLTNSGNGTLFPFFSYQIRNGIQEYRGQSCTYGGNGQYNSINNGCRDTIYYSIGKYHNITIKTGLTFSIIGGGSQNGINLPSGLILYSDNATGYRTYTADKSPVTSPDGFYANFNILKLLNTTGSSKWVVSGNGAYWNNIGVTSLTSGLNPWDVSWPSGLSIGVSTNTGSRTWSLRYTIEANEDGGDLRNDYIAIDTANTGSLPTVAFANYFVLLSGESNFKPIQNWATRGANNFGGYLDKFYFFSGLPFQYCNTLASGLYSIATGYQGSTTTTCYTTGYNFNSGFSYTGVTGIFVSGFSSGISGITGYTTGISGYSYSGITGYSGKSLGIYVDNCGNSQTLYQQVPVSGLISGTYVTAIALTGFTYITGTKEIQLTGTKSGSSGVYITGQVCNNIFTVTGDILYDIDKGYLSSLSYSEISLLSNIKQNEDIVEVYNEPYQNISLNYNIDLVYDNLNNYYTKNEILDSNKILLFANGQTLFNSGYILTQDGYDTNIIPSADYYITGNIIITNNNFNINDNLFYDSFTGNITGFLLTGYSSGSVIPNVNFSNSLVFYNGQKLISGIDYTGSNRLNFSISSGENYILIKNLPSNIIYKLGSTGTLNLNNKKINNECTEVYLNGVKQKLNTNYVENSIYDLISGNYTEPSITSIIYNNTDDFFNFNTAFPTGALAFWKLDDVTDAINGNTLTNNGGAQFVAGKIGYCAQFNLSNSLRTATLSSPFNPNGEFTASIWINPASFSYYQAFIGYGSFIMHTNGLGGIYFNEGADGDVYIQTGLSTGVWQHAVFIKSLDGNSKVWLNGANIYNQATQNAENYGPVSNMTLGTYNTSTYAYDGKLDMVGLWNRELTEQEIQQLYNNGNGIEP